MFKHDKDEQLEQHVI